MHGVSKMDKFAVEEELGTAVTANPRCKPNSLVNWPWLMKTATRSLFSGRTPISLCCSHVFQLMTSPSHRGTLPSLAPNRGVTQWVSIPIRHTRATATMVRCSGFERSAAILGSTKDPTPEKDNYLTIQK